MEEITNRKIESIEEQLRQLENRQKILRNRKADAERKARTKRLIEHGAILESVFPEVVTMSGQEVTAFLRGKA